MTSLTLHHYDIMTVAGRVRWTDRDTWVGRNDRVVSLLPRKLPHSLDRRRQEENVEGNMANESRSKAIT